MPLQPSKRLGFSLLRIKGNHRILGKEGHPFILNVPVHGNKDLKLGTLRGIIRNSGFTEEQFMAAL